MKRSILFLFVLLSYSLTSFAYDFSAVASSGQTLYYTISGNNVSVTYPNTSSDHWGSYTKPVGNLIISDTVTHNDTTYTVTSIGYYAFIGCTDLTSVTIPNSVTSIGPEAFLNCTGLTSVTFNADSCTFAGYDYYDRAFYNCTNITSFTFGNNVKVIPNYLCKNLTGLTSVTIPNSVTSIGRGAFQQCTGLISVAFNADSCTYAGYYYSSYDNVTTWAFKGCTNITSFTFGNNVKIIPDHLCDYLTGLTSVTIPNSVTSIGSFAFYRCSGLTSATIGNSVTSIGRAAFYKCLGLISVIIGDSVNSIGEAAFYQCSGLTSVTIPNSVTSIGSEAFVKCTGLTSVTIPCSVISIGEVAFMNCTGLTSVVFNADSCTYAGTNTDARNIAFSGCTNITSFTFGNNVKVIPNYLCIGLTGLTSVTIPNSVTSIGSFAFYCCLGLTSVTIGNSVTSIGQKAFKSCTTLTTITFLSPTPPNIVSGFSSAFEGLVSNYVVYIPCGSMSQYAYIIPTLHLYYMPYDYEFFAVSADDSTGSVNILTEPSCTNPNAVISAIPANGYRFDHWSTGSTDNPYTLTVTSDTTITAFFVEYIPATYTITVLVNNPATGSVTGGGVYEEGTSVTITAFPADGYRFDHWSTGSTDNPYTLTVTSDTTITAFFVEYTPETYNVTVIVDNPATGSVTGGGVYEDGSSVTITAYPADGYHFDHWSTGSTDNPYTLTVTSDTTIIAYFVSNGGTEGIGDVEGEDIQIIVSNGCVVVEGVEPKDIQVYDITGRTVQNRALPSGVYIVKVGTLPAQKVVVMR